ncbi:MAG: alpha/beta fold hydrolase [Acidobacteriota bacterium]
MAATFPSPATGSRDSAPPRKRLPPLPPPDWLPKGAWPFETAALDFEGTTLAVTEAGAGPALLLVHTGTWSFLWRDVILRLERDFRCVCFDAPGTGRSGRLPASGITLDRAARALDAVVEALDLRDFTLVVHDLGGPSGIAGAARRPERVRGIAAVNAFGWRPEGRLFRGALALVGSPLVRELDVAAKFIPRLSATSFGVGRRMDGESRRAFLAGMEEGRVRAFHRYLEDARRADGLFGAVDRALRGPFRDLPLLTIFGERNDPFGFQPRWKALFPEARQIVVAKGNHFPMCDDPDLVAGSIRSWHRERIARLG